MAMVVCHHKTISTSVPTPHMWTLSGKCQTSSYLLQQKQLKNYILYENFGGHLIHPVALYKYTVIYSRYSIICYYFTNNPGAVVLSTPPSTLTFGLARPRLADRPLPRVVLLGPRGTPLGQPRFLTKDNWSLSLVFSSTSETATWSVLVSWGLSHLLLSSFFLSAWKDKLFKSNFKRY